MLGPRPANHHWHHPKTPLKTLIRSRAGPFFPCLWACTTLHQFRQTVRILSDLQLPMVKEWLVASGGRGHSDAVLKSAINSCHIRPSSPGCC